MDFSCLKFWDTLMSLVTHIPLIFFHLSNINFEWLKTLKINLQSCSMGIFLILLMKKWYLFSKDPNLNFQAKIWKEIQNRNSNCFWKLCKFWYRVSHIITTPNYSLEIIVIIKIESNPCYIRIYETFEQDWGKNFFLIFDNTILLFQKKSIFQIHQFWTFFHQNFRKWSSGQ